jgi:hypothetical protein
MNIKASSSNSHQKEKTRRSEKAKLLMNNVFGPVKVLRNIDVYDEPYWAFSAAVVRVYSLLLFTSTFTNINHSLDLFARGTVCFGKRNSNSFRNSFPTTVWRYSILLLLINTDNSHRLL